MFYVARHKMAQKRGSGARREVQEALGHSRGDYTAKSVRNRGRPWSGDPPRSSARPAS
jgi:hypothetical protein